MPPVLRSKTRELQAEAKRLAAKSFLNLPSEVRSMIFSHLIPETSRVCLRPIASTFYDSGPPRAVYSRQPWCLHGHLNPFPLGKSNEVSEPHRIGITKNPFSLMGTNKRTRDEVGRQFYSTVNFDIFSLDAAACFTHLIPTEFRPLVSSISLDWFVQYDGRQDDDTLRFIFGSLAGLRNFAWRASGIPPEIHWNNTNWCIGEFRKVLVILLASNKLSKVYHESTGKGYLRFADADGVGTANEVRIGVAFIRKKVEPHFRRELAELSTKYGGLIQLSWIDG